MHTQENENSLTPLPPACPCPPTSHSEAAQYSSALVKLPSVHFWFSTRSEGFGLVPTNHDTTEPHHFGRLTDASQHTASVSPVRNAGRPAPHPPSLLSLRPSHTKLASSGPGQENAAPGPPRASAAGRAAPRPAPRRARAAAHADATGCCASRAALRQRADLPAEDRLCRGECRPPPHSPPLSARDDLSPSSLAAGLRAFGAGRSGAPRPRAGSAGGGRPGRPRRGTLTRARAASPAALRALPPTARAGRRGAER